MITFICFVLWKLNAPWWVYVLSIIGILAELDSSNLAKKEHLQILEQKLNLIIAKL
jgi:hypothetical protein